MEQTLGKDDQRPPELRLVAYGDQQDEIIATAGLWRKISKQSKEYFGGKTDKLIPAGARILIFKNEPRKLGVKP